MNKFFRYFMITMLLAAFAVPVYAGEFSPPPPPSPSIQELLDRISALESELSAAQRPQPTPRPVANPHVRLVQPQSLVLTPGEVQYVDLTVRNIGNAPANNVLVSASPSGDAPFSVEFVNNSNTLGNMGQNVDRTVRVRLRTHPDAPAGSHSLSIGFAFRTRETNESSEDSISIRIDAQAREPRIMLRDFTISSGTIFPGDSFVISAQLHNLGEGNAYNVQTTIAEGLDADSIFISGSPNTPFLQTVEPGHVSLVSFPFTASSRMAGGGTFDISFELRGSDRAGEAISERVTYTVTVLAPQEGDNRASLSLSLGAPGGVFEVGDRAGISVVVTNNGRLPARNIRVAANPVSDAIVPQSTPRETIGNLAPGESRTLNFIFSPTSEAASQYHAIGFEVTYQTGSGDDTETFEQFAGINVHNPDRANENRGSRPRILISAYSVDPMIVSAGREFDLSMTFQNTSTTRAVYNIKITLSAVEYEERSGAVFTTVGASNTLFVDRMAPGEEITRDLRMFTVPNALPRTYNIEVLFEYEDEDFEEFTERELLSINVRQVTRLEVRHLHMQSHAMLFNPVFVDFSVINSGRVTLSNLNIEMEGDTFDTTGMNIWVGNMGMGNTANYSGQFTPMEVGEHHGAIIVSGEDATGEVVEYRHEFTIFVDEMPVWDDMGFDDMGMMHGRPGFDDGMMMVEHGEGRAWLPLVIGALVVIGVGAAVTIFIIRKRNNNRDIFQDLQ